MKEVESIIFSTICLMTVTNALAKTEIRPNNNLTSTEMQCLDLHSGIKLYVKGKHMWINVRILELFGENAIQGRDYYSEQTKTKKSIKKIGFMMMMAPFAMQLISLPGSIASIKMSLLRSIFVAKLAILMMIYNMIVNMKSEVIVVQQPQHHEHYYNQYQQYEEDHDGWFGR
ncbi:PREDICTED: uncharacterized protein LOC107064245 [Polistes dominula]|uniref:Uncharacterized protein LOC107064245 n=1 Tax=Polistes dominula TaxID=743375 RepID=A0ABM1HW18_POLDO|nr:PREDICTED: uncharacterized protein LOC107064245 [Polistes dominula]XP_015172155.1 PREDICTED: uncharacterized protein LOC107064245 [Polistes dominula]